MGLSNAYARMTDEARVKACQRSSVLEAPRGVGWAVLKVVTLVRYRGFRDGDVLVEGSLGLVTIAASCFLVYRWWP